MQSAVTLKMMIALFIFRLYGNLASENTLFCLHCLNPKIRIYRKALDFKQFAVERKIFFHKDVDWHQVVDLGLVLLVEKVVDGGFDGVETL